MLLVMRISERKLKANFQLCIMKLPTPTLSLKLPFNKFYTTQYYIVRMKVPTRLWEQQSIGSTIYQCVKPLTNVGDIAEPVLQ